LIISEKIKEEEENNNKSKQHDKINSSISKVNQLEKNKIKP
jgi:hypothetical protein